MHLLHKLVTALAVLPLFALPTLAEDHPDAIHVHDAYALSNGSNGAVFFLLHNHTDTDITITGATSDQADLTELHTHKEDANGVMSMMKIEGGIPVAAGEVHEFARGGDHVMLMGLKSEWAEGDRIAVTLTFDGAESLRFEATVSANAMKGGQDGAGHDHAAMDHAQMGHAQHGAADGSAGQAQGQAQPHAHAHGATKAPALDTSGMTDPQAIAAIMKAQFETPQSPLTVEPVIVEGDHAIAAWAQDGTGGRSLLQRRDGVWTILLCAGEDLRQPAFLAARGVTGADRLSGLFNQAEEALGADAVRLHSSFQGVVMIAPQN